MFLFAFTVEDTGNWLLPSDFPIKFKDSQTCFQHIHSGFQVCTNYIRYMKIVLLTTSISTCIYTFPTHIIHKHRQNSRTYLCNCTNWSTKMVTAKRGLVSGQQCCSLLALSVYNKGEIWKCAHKSGVCGVYVIYKTHFVSEKTRFSCICWSQVDHHLFSIPLYPFFREANNQEIWLPFLAPLLDSIISSSKYHLFE